MESFSEWKKTLKEVVHPDYKKYDITELDDADYFAIYYYKNKNPYDPYKMLLDRFKDGKKYIQNFYDWFSERETYLPKNYFYSNGSEPRNDGSVGWN